ncbi:MAG: NAD-dependent epimerase/dehydratase family protein, partial [Chitinivibrionales bacterium]|nr:NAD-dependent epimerase/dehydratase family protein [Chitinivibrionales bacterium]MBD3394326.1 NAD-dependent epimerase/dehydratase family protein [Chitinivibrionales bacterium]
YRLLDGIEAMVHLAGHPNDFARDPQTTYSENVRITVNLMHAGLESGMRRVVYASSIQAITRSRPTHENPVSPCSLPYLPADGNIPSNPGNLYGLSKQACEEMLRYYEKMHGISSVALRFPFLVRPEWMGRMKKGRRQHMMGWRCLDELFAFLPCDDAARLILAMLKTPLQGFRVYTPAARYTRTDEPVAELIREYYSNVELRKPLEEIDGLIDMSRITEETGWEPQDGPSEPDQPKTS